MKFKWLDFKITNRCNDHCTYCGVEHDSPTAPERVSSKALSKTILEAKELGFTHFAFLGGEPSLRNDFPILMKPLQMGDKVDTVMVITNMLLFNETMYKAVFQTRAKKAHITASIDSLTEPNYKHQNTSQTLSYISLIQELAKKYSKYGTREVQVHTVISRENLHQLVSHVQFFAQRNIEVSLAIVEPFKIVGPEEHRNEYNTFTKDEIAEIIEQLDGLEELGLLNWANTITREYLKTVLTDKLDRVLGCTAGTAHVIVDPLGNVYPCLTEAYRRGLYFGNISTEPFRLIYQKMSSFRCANTFQQTCWDHLLWTKMEKMLNSKDKGTDL